MEEESKRESFNTNLFSKEINITINIYKIAIINIGIENFDFIILQEVKNKEHLTSYEQSYFEYYKHFKGVFNHGDCVDCVMRRSQTFTTSHSKNEIKVWQKS